MCGTAVIEFVHKSIHENLRACGPRHNSLKISLKTGYEPYDFEMTTVLSVRLHFQTPQPLNIN